LTIKAISTIIRHIRYLTVSILLLVVLVLRNSAYIDLSTKEIEWRHQIDAENWAMCDNLLRFNKVTSFHREHHHYSGGVVGLDQTLATRVDLVDNNCKLALGAYWLEY